jgi:hypothetical protein
MSGTSHFWSRSQRKKHFGPGPVQKKIWSRSRPSQKKKLFLGAGGTGTTSPISRSVSSDDKTVSMCSYLY